jgi:hypothetical protein
MQTWLTDIGIDAEGLKRKSFVHLPLELAQGIWGRVQARFEGDVVRARWFFTSPHVKLVNLQTNPNILRRSAG